MNINFRKLSLSALTIILIISYFNHNYQLYSVNGNSMLYDYYNGDLLVSKKSSFNKFTCTQLKGKNVVYKMQGRNRVKRVIACGCDSVKVINGVSFVNNIKKFNNNIRLCLRLPVSLIKRANIKDDFTIHKLGELGYRQVCMRFKDYEKILYQFPEMDTINPNQYGVIEDLDISQLVHTNCDDYFYLLGDNRMFSRDSREHGLVKVTEIKSYVLLKLLSF